MTVIVCLDFLRREKTMDCKTQLNTTDGGRRYLTTLRFTKKSSIRTLRWNCKRGPPWQKGENVRGKQCETDTADIKCFYCEAYAARERWDFLGNKREPCWFSDRKNAPGRDPRRFYCHRRIFEDSGKILMCLLLTIHKTNAVVSQGMRYKSTESRTVISTWINSDPSWLHCQLLKDELFNYYLLRARLSKWEFQWDVSVLDPKQGV